MIRVFIADDHEFIRAGLTSILAAIPDIEVIGEAANGHDVLQALREKTPDALVLDMSMPGMDGAETFRRLREVDPEARVVITSGHCEADVNVQFPNSSLAGFLQKPYDLASLVRMTKSVIAG